MRFAYALAIVALAACSTGGSGRTVVTPTYPEGLPTPQEPDAAADGTCDGGCAVGAICAYALDGGCGAAGICVPVTPNAPPCKAYNLCGCDGVAFLDRCDVPAGYSQAPSAGGYMACELDAASDGSDGSDGGTSCAEISASRYDQSCANDSDCVLVAVGPPCGSCLFQCGLDVAAINVDAKTQYMSDVSRTPKGGVPCDCPPPPPIPNFSCCRSGQCRADNDCVSSGDAGAE